MGGFILGFDSDREDMCQRQLQVMLRAFAHNPDRVADGVAPIVAAWRWRAVALADAPTRIGKIHVDFRTDVIYYCETVNARIRGLFAPFASELDRQGIDLAPQKT